MYSDFDSAPSGYSLSATLFTRIREDILKGKLKNGEKLIEQRICEEYEVSRTPVREAFKQLEIEGLIENTPNRGAVVTGFTPSDIMDIYDLRKACEVLAVKWAIARISAPELESLVEAYEFMEFYTQRQDYVKMLNINSSFHELIYKAAHNKLLAQTLSSYQYYIKQTRLATDQTEGYLKQVLAEHKKILDAFILKDMNAGAEAMADHLDNAKMRAHHSSGQ